MSPVVRSALRSCLPALLLALSGCGPGRNEFAPVCPSARLVPELADVTRYAGDGKARDLTDMVIQARIVTLGGECHAGDEKSLLPATVHIGMTVLRGPAMIGREADLAVFLAVAEGDTVRDKRVFPVRVVFPPNVDRLTMSSPDITLNMPVSATRTGASYGIIAGFQLSPEELAANRAAQINR
jgi:hypothetical protein